MHFVDPRGAGGLFFYYFFAVFRTALKWAALRRPLSGGWRGWWVATRWDVWQEASSGLLRKTQNRRKKKESESWRRGETDEKGGRTLLLGKKFLLERIHAGLAFLRLKFLHYYRFAIFFLLISEYLLWSSKMLNSLFMVTCRVSVLLLSVPYDGCATYSCVRIPH